MLGSEFHREFSKSQSFEVYGINRDACDLRDKRKTQELIEDLDPDLIIHCAAVVGGISANVAHPVDFLLQNLLIDTSVIGGALQASVENFIYMGSSCMYPKNLNRKLIESDLLSAPLEPTNEGYALAKISGSKLATFISREYGFNYKTIVPSNLYGPGDEFSEKYSHLVAATLLKAHNAKKSDSKKIDVWGDGTARREFTYIADLSRWLVSQVNRIGDFPEILNVGAGVDYSIDEFYEAAMVTVGYQAHLNHDLTKPTGMTSKLMDSTFAREHFEWNPSTSLLDGMKNTYEHFLLEENLV